MGDSTASLLLGRPKGGIFYTQRVPKLSSYCKATWIRKENNHNLYRGQITYVATPISSNRTKNHLREYHFGSSSKFLI